MMPSNDAKFWRTIRRALLLIARAIDERYPDRAADQRR